MNEKELHGSYDPLIFKAIIDSYKSTNGSYGYQKIHTYIKQNYSSVNIKNVKTIHIYMKFIDVKAKIRKIKMLGLNVRI